MKSLLPERTCSWWRQTLPAVRRRTLQQISSSMRTGQKWKSVLVALDPKAAAIIPKQASAQLHSTAASVNSVPIKPSAAPRPSSVPAGRRYPQTRNGIPNSRDTGAQKSSAGCPASATEWRPSLPCYAGNTMWTICRCVDWSEADFSLDVKSAP